MLTSMEQVDKKFYAKMHTLKNLKIKKKVGKIK